MKKTRALLLGLILLLLVFIPIASVNAQSPTPTPVAGTTGDQVVIANTYRLKSGDILDGNLAVIGGTATIEKLATVTGDVFLVGGTLTISGTINGDIIAVGGAANLEDEAIVNGDVTVIGATINRSPLATVMGNFTEQSPAILDFNFAEPQSSTLPVKPEDTPFEKILWTSLRALITASIAALIGLMLPEPIKRVSKTLRAQPGISLGVGLLVTIGFPVVILLMIVTILLIPVAALAVILLVLTLFYGWMVVGFEIGNKISEVSHANWPVSISAGIGTLILTLVVGVASLIPCLGWILGFVIAIFGLGCVVMARYGFAKWAAKVRYMPPPVSTPPANPQ